MVKPNVYTLGGRPEIDMTVYDLDGVQFIPAYARISIKQPDGNIITVSGGISVSDGDMVAGSGYLYYLYRPPVKGWYEYEQWGADNNFGSASGREGTDTNGFDVVDRVS